MLPLIWRGPRELDNDFPPDEKFYPNINQVYPLTELIVCVPSIMFWVKMIRYNFFCGEWIILELFAVISNIVLQTKLQYTLLR